MLRGPTLEDDVRVLRAHFRALGFERVPSARIAASLVLRLLAGHAALVVALVTNEPTTALLAVLVAAFCLLAAATMGHTASHGSLFEGPALNRLVVWVTYPLSIGLSGRYWLHSHVKVHHPAPNVIDVDDDANLRPLFCMTEADLERSPRRWRPLFRFQLAWLLLLLPLNGTSYQLQGLAHLQKDVRAERRHRAACLRDALGLVLHVALRIGVPLLFCPASRVFAVYAGWVIAASYGMFVILAPGHFPHAARSLGKNAHRAGSFFLRQTATTVNFRTGWLGAVLCSGLEYQIEHHLFPRYCHVHYPKMAPLVRELCERHRLPYSELGWDEAIFESFRTFVTPKPVVDDVNELLTGRMNEPC